MKRSIKPAVIFFSLLSLLFFYLLNRLTFVIEGLDGNIIETANKAVSLYIPSIKDNPVFIGTSRGCLISGACGFIIAWLIFIYNLIPKRYMRGKEHGSAEWGNKKDIKNFMNPDMDKNIILSATEFLDLGKARDFEYDRNNNVLIIGGSGSGKTYSQTKPNLMQLHSSYIITDPKGTCLPDTGKMLIDNGYEVRWLNTVEMHKSMHYNPLAYIHEEEDILKVVTVLLENTTGDGKEGDKFWKDCESLLYTAVIAYLWEEAPEKDLTIPTMIDMLDLFEAREDDENFVSPADILFEELEATKPKCLAVKQYKKFKKAAGKTMKSILISAGARLAPFDIQKVNNLMQYDELRLDEIGDRPTALFVIMSDTDKTFSFIIAMMMYQLFNLLCEKADIEYGGTLPYHVRCMLDEFANCGKIPNFENLISTIRSRNISVTMMLQSMSQIQAVYKDQAETIVDCCDSTVFLGGKSQKTTKAISEMIGKTTIDNQNTTESKGQSGSFTKNNQILGRDLIDPAEVARLKRSECIVMITGVKPFRSQKYNTEKHKRYSYLADADKTNKFDTTKIEEYKDNHFLDGIEKIQKVELSELNNLSY